MHSKRWFPAVLGLVLLLVTAPGVRADSIAWSYSSFSYPSFISPDSGGYVDPWNPYYSNSGVGFYTTSGNMMDSSSIILANTYTQDYGWYWPPSNDPKTYNHTPFRITLGITDYAYNRSGVLTFNGYIDGSFSAYGSNLKFTFDNPEQHLHLGHHVYEVNLDSITNPGQPGGGYGAIGATVTVHNNPEPTSLVLLGLGIPGAMGFYWRRRKKTA